ARRRKENAAAERREAHRRAYPSGISGDPEIGPPARTATGAALPHQRLSALCSPRFFRGAEKDKGHPEPHEKPASGALAMTRQDAVGRAKRSVPAIRESGGHVAPLLCPPYGSALRLDHDPSG